MDAVVINPARGVDIDATGDDEDDGLGEPVAELGGDGKGNDDELKLEASTPNSNASKVSVCPV